MKALIQRAMNARVSVNGEVISSIGQGACVFIGINQDDTMKDVEFMAKKLLSIKLFDDNEKKWKKSIVDKEFEILCISQFTLYATWKGNRPDYHKAMPGEKSKELYDKLIELMRKQYKPDRIKEQHTRFHKMMGGEKSQEFYNKMMERCKNIYDPDKVKDSVFRLYRQIQLENDCPVTFQIESPEEFRWGS